VYTAARCDGRNTKDDTYKKNRFYINITNELIKQTLSCFKKISANRCRIRVGVITDSRIITRRSRQFAIMYLNKTDLCIDWLLNIFILIYL
jgi:hypothetical protein